MAAPVTVGRRGYGSLQCHHYRGLDEVVAMDVEIFLACLGHPFGLRWD